jgi:hypothetical protein
MVMRARYVEVVATAGPMLAPAATSFLVFPTGVFLASAFMPLAHVMHRLFVVLVSRHIFISFRSGTLAL